MLLHLARSSLPTVDGNCENDRRSPGLLGLPAERRAVRSGSPPSALPLFVELALTPAPGSFGLQHRALRRENPSPFQACIRPRTTRRKACRQRARLDTPRVLDTCRSGRREVARKGLHLPPIE